MSVNAIRATREMEPVPVSEPVFMSASMVCVVKPHSLSVTVILAGLVSIVAQTVAVPSTAPALKELVSVIIVIIIPWESAVISVVLVAMGIL